MKKLAAPNVIPGRRAFLTGTAALSGSALMLASMNDGARAQERVIAESW
jgi:branched-chain amino acid transport system substrate-binding protein